MHWRLTAVLSGQPLTEMSVSGRSLAMHAQLALTWHQAPAPVPRAVYGSWVVSAQPLTLPEEACWFRYDRKQILRDLLYTAWGLSVYDWCARASWAQGMAPETLPGLSCPASMH